MNSRKTILLLLLSCLAVPGIKAHDIPQNDPNWSVSPSDFQFSMTVVAYVRLSNAVSDDENDQIGIFVGDQLRGTGNLGVLVGSTSTRVAFIQVYSNTSSGENLTFKIYDASEDEVIDAVSTETFADGKKLGENLNPFEVTDNSLASEITLSIASIDENATAGTVSATLGNNDPDEGQAYIYELIGGEGDDDNGDFSISDNTLTLNTTYDFESKASVNIRLKVTDSKNGSYEQAFELDINDQNDAPTELNLDINSLGENQSVGAEIGSFSSTDQDDGDSHTYELVTGTGSEDNSNFTIDNSGKLFSAAQFDFENKASFSIRVKSTDLQGGSIERAFTINIEDLNDAPTAISLSESSIDENVGSIKFAMLSAIDQDAGDTHTFELISGTGDADNSSFTIRNGVELYTTESFDYETKSSYSIRLKVSDNESGSFQESFTIAINNVNDSPTDISISNALINENENAGTLIGAFSAVDQDAGESFFFSLVAGDGDEGNDFFEIQSLNELVTKSAFNFENIMKYSVRVKVTDSEGASFEKVLSIQVLDVNDSPTAIVLSSSSVPENSGASASIGNLTASDEDSGDSHSFELVSGQGDDDNEFFEISSGVLKSKADFDFEAKSSYSVRLKVTDNGGLTYESVHIISVVNINESPTSIDLSNLSLSENLGTNAFIGTLMATDPDANSGFTYELVAGTGDENNGSFIINNSNQLRANSSFDFEAKSSYSIRAKVTDNGGLSFERAFVLSIQDANDSPTELSLSTGNIDENQSAVTVVGSFAATDQDVSDTHTFKLIEGDGDDSNSLFTINSSGELLTKSALNFEEATSHSIRVITSDSQGASFQKSFNISVTDANDAPSNILIDHVSLAENLGVGHEVGTLSVTDEDEGDTHVLALAEGEDSDDNASFEIKDGKLLTAVDLDFEQQSVFKIRVKAEDNEGATYESTFSINVKDVNEAPGNLKLSRTFLDENLKSGAIVGALTASDEDASESLVFSLVSGVGDTDNTTFAINNSNELTAGNSFDYESKNSYSVRVRVTDKAGLYTEKSYAIAVIDQNDSPSEIEISAAVVVENVSGEVVGALIATDQDVSDAHTFKLIEGDGDDSNSLFTINSSGELLTKAALNFEEAPIHSIRVITTDSQGASFQKSFNISVTDANDAPTEINLSQATVLENLSSNTEIGSILVADEDVSDTHTLSFASGLGDTDNGSFSIGNGKLVAKNPFDFESQNSYSIRLKAVDSRGEQVEQVLVITILDDNDEPTAISLSTNKIDENESAETPIGFCQVTDQDANSTYSYTLVSGEGDDDNASFQFIGNQLVSGEVFDHEAKNEYLIRVRASENGGNEIEAVFAIQVEDVNESPTAIALSGNSIAENSAGGTIIGVITVDDPDEGDSYDFVLKNGVKDNLSFGMNGGNQLVVAGVLNFEDKNSYAITIEALDDKGNRYEESYTINILNVAEPGIAPSVESIDFGLTDIGRGGSSKNFEVFNDGPDGILEITDFELPDGFSVSPQIATLNPGETMAFTLTFEPENEGLLEDEVKIISNAGQPIIAVTGEAQLVAGFEDLPNISAQVKVFPNPVKDKLFVDASVFGNQPYAYQLVSLGTGRVVEFKETNREKILEINTSLLTSGLYAIELSNSDKVARKKLMVIR